MKAGESIQAVTYDMAQSEIAESTGLMDLARQGGGGIKTKGEGKKGFNEGSQGVRRSLWFQRT